MTIFLKWCIIRNKAKEGSLSMEDIITKLAEIETAASRIMENVSEQKIQLAKEQEAKIRDFDRRIEADTQAELQKIREQLEIEMKQKLEAQEKETQKTLDQMESYYQVHHTELAKQIYDRIIRKE